MSFNGCVAFRSHFFLILITLSLHCSYLKGFKSQIYFSNLFTNKNVLKYTTSLRDTRSDYAEVCIVGGGPVGLAVAIALSRPPHNYNCVVFESNPTVTEFNPRKGFLYNVNRRGRVFTTKYPTLDIDMQKNGVMGDMAKVVIVPGDPMKPLPQLALDVDKESETEKDNLLKSNSKGDKASDSIWMKRHDMTRILQDYSINKVVEEEFEEGVTGSVKIMPGKKLVNIFSSENHETSHGGVQIEVEDMKNNQITTYNCDLLVGADGYRSMVRECISNDDPSSKRLKRSSKWEKIPKHKFQVKSYKSPATGLRFKALLFPPQFSIGNVNNTEVKLKGQYLYGFRSINTGPLDTLGLGFLPVKDIELPRTGNIIARPNHDVWKIDNVEDLKKWFQKSFPRINFDKVLSDDEWKRFLDEEGISFPFCSYTNGVATCSRDKNSAVVLVGDALHSYPPDIGQGVNSGLMDVVELSKALEDVDLSADKQKTGEKTLSDALKAYEKNRLKETKSLIRFARIGAPYQYNQPMLRDRIGKKLWMINFMTRLVINKLSFGIIPPAAILIATGSNLSFRRVMILADLVTFGLGSISIWVLKSLFWNKSLPIFG